MANIRRRVKHDRQRMVAALRDLAHLQASLGSEFPVDNFPDLVALGLVLDLLLGLGADLMGSAVF